MLNGETKLEPPATPASVIRANPLETNGLRTPADSGDERDLHKPDMGEPSSPEPECLLLSVKPLASEGRLFEIFSESFRAIPVR